MKPAPHISDIMVGPEIYSPVCFLPRVIPGQWPGVKDHAMGRGISHPGRQVHSGAYGPHACEYVFRSPPVRSFRTHIHPESSVSQLAPWTYLPFVPVLRQIQHQRLGSLKVYPGHSMNHSTQSCTWTEVSQAPELVFYRM